ncbi:PREDICTED: uncharacterized protein LOC104608581 [Nelumbo nucifera]|uniref:Uncharacterized protein LOC104608581 n=1 Tax=Nelumbo nucifera TaxID=4432 RepID=A0A1U8B993_NELNU|nr:PREDICTED: uncharacterized protein LOC104608581 [Nelumbo nucifera]
MGWLLMILTKLILAHVIGCTSSRSIRIILEQLYASKSRVRVMQLHFELHSLKKGALSVPQYLQKGKNLTDNLTAAGEPLSDTDYILTILSGLSSEYESFITAVTTRVDAYTVEDIKGMLLNQEIQLGQLKGSHGSLDSNYPVANMAVRGNANFNNINDSHNFSKGNKSYPQLLNLNTSVRFVGDLLTKKVLLQRVNEGGIYKLSNSHNVDTHTPFADVGERTNIDVCHYCWLYPMSHKSDALSIFINFKHLVENYLDTKIKAIQSDMGGEFVKLHEFLQSEGIAHQFVYPHTQEQNSRAKHKHRQIEAISLTLLATASMPKHFWLDASQTIVYMMNQLPSVAVNASNTMATGRLYISRHVVFAEESFPFASMQPTAAPVKSSFVLLDGPSIVTSQPTAHKITTIPSTTEKAHIQDTAMAHNTPPQSDHSTTVIPLISRGFDPPSSLDNHANITSGPPINPLNTHHMQTRLNSGIQKPKVYLASKHPIDASVESTCYSEAAKHAHWRQAMEDEFNALL